MDNQNYYKPKPAVLISTSRSGSTFLLNALDSHYQIGCERSEPLNHKTGPWRDVEIDRHQLMNALWSRPGYRVSMFKLSYRQAGWVGLKTIKKRRALIIHLHRENVVRVIASSMINTMAVAGKLNHPTHSFTTPKPVKVAVDVAKFMNECRKYQGKVAGMVRDLDALDMPVKYLTYEDLIGYEGNEVEEVQTKTANSICDFLEVNRFPLFSETKRINPQPLGEIVENWRELRAALVNNGLGQWCEDDAA